MINVYSKDSGSLTQIQSTSVVHVHACTCKSLLCGWPDIELFDNLPELFSGKEKRQISKLKKLKRRISASFGRLCKYELSIPT